MAKKIYEKHTLQENKINKYFTLILSKNSLLILLILIKMYL